jgi:alpha-beta hydrolase superfamily lysophospholipase
MSAETTVQPEEATPSADLVAEGASPCVFGDPSAPLFGFFHVPRGVPRTCAVVLCNPFGYESLCVHRAYRHLAEQLAAAGFAVLRFDHHGTGDSSGNDTDPDRVRTWIDGIHRAADAVKARAQATSVALFGVRLGATLAAVAGAERNDVDDAVLWAPPVGGKAYARELRAFRLLKGEAPPHPDDPVIDGEEAVGFVLTKTTLAALGKLDLLSLSSRPAARVLLLGREDLAMDARLAPKLRERGAHVEERIAEGYPTMMLDPHESVVPESAFRAVVDWLSAAHDARKAVRISSIASSERTMRLRLPDDSTVREECARFGRDDELFGIVTTPETRHPTRSRTGVVFLNVGANHRVGPNRMYVVMARRLASLGFAALRFDIAGLGDSPSRPGKTERRLYALDSVEDVRAAIELLRAEHGVDRIVLVGLCSGAYLAYHSAARIPGLAAQVLINPQTFAWNEGDSLKLAVRQAIKSQDFYRKAIWQPETWRRALRGELHLAGIARGLARKLRKRVENRTRRAIYRTLRLRPDPADVAGTLLDLDDNNTRVLMLFSAEDGGIDEMESHLGPAAAVMRDARAFRLAFIERADHTFTTTSAQKRLSDLVADHLVRFA